MLLENVFNNISFIIKLKGYILIDINIIRKGIFGKQNFINLECFFVKAPGHDADSDFKRTQKDFNNFKKTNEFFNSFLPNINKLKKLFIYLEKNKPLESNINKFIILDNYKDIYIKNKLGELFLFLNLFHLLMNKANKFKYNYLESSILYNLLINFNDYGIPIIKNLNWFDNHINIVSKIKNNKYQSELIVSTHHLFQSLHLTLNNKDFFYLMNKLENLIQTNSIAKKLINNENKFLGKNCINYRLHPFEIDNL